MNIYISDTVRARVIKLADNMSNYDPQFMLVLKFINVFRETKEIQFKSKKLNFWSVN